MQQQEIEKYQAEMDFETWPNPRVNGVMFRFDNDYGASVIRHSGSYGGSAGRMELAVIHFRSEDSDDWDFVYDTELTSDVLGWLTSEDVIGVLRKIKGLPERQKALPAGRKELEQ